MPQVGSGIKGDRGVSEVPLYKVAGFLRVICQQVAPTPGSGDLRPLQARWYQENSTAVEVTASGVRSSEAKSREEQCTNSAILVQLYMIGSSSQILFRNKPL